MVCGHKDYLFLATVFAIDRRIDDLAIVEERLFLSQRSLPYYFTDMCAVVRQSVLYWLQFHYKIWDGTLMQTLFSWQNEYIFANTGSWRPGFYVRTSPGCHVNELFLFLQTLESQVQPSHSLYVLRSRT